MGESESNKCPTYNIVYCCLLSDCNYHVSTLTGNDVNAGTRARVFLKLQGSEARSGWIRLYNPGKTQFTPGK